MRRALLRWAPAAGWEGVIFWQSSLKRVPGTAEGEAAFGAYLPLLAHVAEYLVLALLMGLALRVAPGRGRWWVLAFGLTVALGILDEVHQAFVPGRTPALSDVGLDTLGAAAALIVWRGWWEVRLRRRGLAYAPGPEGPDVPGPSAYRSSPR